MPAWVLAVVLPFGAGGCIPFAAYHRFGPPDQVFPETRTGQDDCSASALRNHLGQPLASLADEVLPGDLRAIHPAQEVTREISPTRLNAQLDEQGVIRRLFCG